MKKIDIAAQLRSGVAPVILAAALLSPSIAIAQDEPQGAQEAGFGENVIVVTGSRIARPELSASTPVVAISNELIQEQGAQNISDVLNELPAVGIGTSRTNSNFSTFGNGVATVNLRNLGANRTLVLQNGRRIVAGIGGTSAVDLNVIPTDLVERVEVVTGGASAVYGSEAMAGVVNFILKDDFEGIRLRAQAGMTSKSDNPRQLISGTIGHNFADNRGNITLFGSYDRDAGLRSKNRAISAEDNPFRSGYPLQGRFFVDDPNASDVQDLSTQFTYTRPNTLKEGFDTPVDGFNRNGERYISVPVERYSAAAIAHYDFTDNVTAFFEGTYVKTKSKSRLEPFALANDDARLDGGDTVLAGLNIDNPFIPDQIRNTALALGQDTIPFFKRFGGIFDRSNRNEREFYRLVGGLRGTFGAEDNWNWDVYYNYGSNTERTASETALRDRLYYAFDAVSLNGETVCRDAAARADGCEPFNPFGFNSASPESVAYVTNNGQLSTYVSKVRQQVAGLNISGSVPGFAAGDIGLAGGFEYRREKSSEVYDAETQLGNTLGNAAENTIGKYNVKEAYAEAVLPLIAERPMVEYLGIEGAMRYADYSTIGSTFSWKIGAEYAPTPDIRFRGVYAIANRAPNISELFSGAAQTFPGPLADPCDGVTATRNNPGDDYCRSVPGIAQQIALDGEFNYDDNLDQQSIEGVDGGNLDLNEEKAKTITAGVVLTPRFLPGFSASVDYFNIRIKDAIQLVPRETSIEQCVLTAGASPLCDLIVREVIGNPRSRTPGTVYQVDSFPINAASIKTSGIDVAASYNTRIGEESRLSFNLAYTYLIKLTLQPLSTIPVENNRNQLDGDGRLGAGFKHKANLSTTFEHGPLTLVYRANLLSSIYDTRPDNSPALDPEFNKIGTFVYHDVQLRAGVGEDRQMEFYLGVDNLFNKKPPVIDQTGASNITGTETAADTYDPIGRYMYAGFTFKF